jgi:hypothetical protein
MNEEHDRFAESVTTSAGMGVGIIALCAVCADGIDSVTVRP